MRKLTLTLLIAILALSLSGCVKVYDTYIRLLEPTPTSGSLTFEDGAIHIQFSEEIDTTIDFQLTNKTASVMRLIWDEVSFVDTEGNVQRIMHNGVRFIERDRSQPPTMIPPKAKISDGILPVNNVSYTSGRYGGWSTKRILPNGMSAKDYHGKVVTMTIPVETNGHRTDYIFSFQVIIQGTE